MAKKTAPKMPPKGMGAKCPPGSKAGYAKGGMPKRKGC
jgi:hypothetical protein